MFRYIFLIFLAVTFISCNKEKDNTKNIQPEKISDQDNDTTSLTPKEAFSSAMVDDILNSDAEEDLRGYLEDDIFPLVANSDKVTIDKISTSLYILKYESAGAEKNLLIQKFYSPSKDEIWFDKSELTADVKKYLLK